MIYWIIGIYLVSVVGAWLSNKYIRGVDEDEVVGALFVTICPILNTLLIIIEISIAIGFSIDNSRFKGFLKKIFVK